jgi:class 3 adenylate cyclase/pimeloyl-ACP methyl ester carboxylesterase
VEVPETRYARSGEIHVAYQVFGEGPDLVFVSWMLSMVFAWLHPLFVDFFERLASFSRLILFDKRGIGASDRPRSLPTLEAQMDDVRAVLDAVASEQAVLFGSGHGAAMCALFAATYPERTSHLVTWNAWPRLPGSPEEHREEIRRVEKTFGREDAIVGGIPDAYPSLVGDESFRRMMPIIMRASASPGSAVDFTRTVLDVDVSDVLPLIRVPTLLMYRKMPRVPADLLALRGLEKRAQELALTMPDARAIGIVGADPNPFVGREVTDEVRRFVTESRQESTPPDRVLATVLFTDLVGSTERAAEVGPGWHELLRRHNATIRRELARFRGREIDTAGDGFFASGFDGPARAIRCACAIRDAIAELGLGVRVGVHTGECDLVDDKLSGLAVTIGARVAGQADEGDVLVSGTVKDLVAGSEIEFEPRGLRELKGLGEWPLFAVVGP